MSVESTITGFERVVVFGAWVLVALSSTFLDSGFFSAISNQLFKFLDFIFQMRQ